MAGPVKARPSPGVTHERCRHGARGLPHPLSRSMWVAAQVVVRAVGSFLRSSYVVLWVVDITHTTWQIGRPVRAISHAVALDFPLSCERKQGQKFPVGKLGRVLGSDRVSRLLP